MKKLHIFIATIVFIIATINFQTYRTLDDIYRVTSVENIDYWELYNLTNKERIKEGKNILKIDNNLNITASNKCGDMAEKNYWSHDSPSMTFDKFIWPYTPKAKKIGENLSFGYKTPQAIVRGWMNSPSHRDNLLSDYTHIGFGICEAYHYQGLSRVIIVVQHFAEIVE